MIDYVDKPEIFCDEKYYLKFLKKRAKKPSFYDCFTIVEARLLRRNSQEIKNDIKNDIKKYLLEWNLEKLKKKLGFL